MSWSSDAINYSQRLVKKYFEKKYVERSFTMFGVGGGVATEGSEREKKKQVAPRNGGVPLQRWSFFFLPFSLQVRE